MGNETFKKKSKLGNEARREATINRAKKIAEQIKKDYPNKFLPSFNTLKYDYKASVVTAKYIRIFLEDAGFTKAPIGSHTTKPKKVKKPVITKTPNQVVKEYLHKPWV